MIQEESEIIRNCVVRDRERSGVAGRRKLRRMAQETEEEMAHYNLPHDHEQDFQEIFGHMPDDGSFRRTADLFGVLGDVAGLRIFWLLCHSGESAGNIAAALEMSDSDVSGYLRRMQEGGLIESRQDGQKTYYRLSAAERASILHFAMDSLFDAGGR